MGRPDGKPGEDRNAKKAKQSVLEFKKKLLALDSRLSWNGFRECELQADAYRSLFTWSPYIGTRLVYVPPVVADANGGYAIREWMSGIKSCGNYEPTRLVDISTLAIDPDRREPFGKHPGTLIAS